MSRFFRIHLYWLGRTDPIAVLATQVSTFLLGLPKIHPALSRLMFDGGPDGGLIPTTSAAEVERALRQSVVPWTVGGKVQSSYAPTFVVDRKSDPPVRIRITCGIEPLGLDAIFTPNRLELVIKRAIGEDRITSSVLASVLNQGVLAFAPDWGFVGTEEGPAPPLAIFSDGTPVIGWMTYFRMGFPPIPRTLPEPSVAYPIGQHGTLVVAHPGLTHDETADQCAAVARVKTVLNDAKVLVAPATLPKG